MISFSITQDAQAEVKHFIENSAGQFEAAVFAAVETGVGHTSIQSDTDAIALAQHARDLINQYRQTYRASQVHLFLVAPARFCVFLGHLLNRAGDIVAYEYSGANGYQPSVLLKT